MPRQYDHPGLLDATRRIAQVCRQLGVVVGNPHVGVGNLERLLGEGYRLLVSVLTRSYGVVGKGRELSGY